MTRRDSVGRTLRPMRRLHFARIVLGGLILACVLAGCLGRSPGVDHYMLGTSTMAGGPVDPSTADVAVRVGPVRLPAYLERSQIARIEARGEIELDEFSRWLGGFEENLLRSLSLGLATELGSIRVVAAPSRPPFPLDYSVRLHVDDLVWLAQEGVLRTRIRWALLRAESETPRLFLFEETRPVVDDRVQGVVETHAAVVDELVRRIASEIRRREASPEEVAP
jgi:uncharacterized lipoprotein YmbA